MIKLMLKISEKGIPIASVDVQLTIRIQDEPEWSGESWMVFKFRPWGYFYWKQQQKCFVLTANRIKTQLRIDYE